MLVLKHHIIAHIHVFSQLARFVQSPPLDHISHNHNFLAQTLQLEQDALEIALLVGPANLNDGA